MRIEVEGNYDLSNFDKFKSIFKNDLGGLFKMFCSFYLIDILPKMAVF